MSDLVSVLATDWPDEFSRVQQLLGQTPPELADGRLALYVCPECGDLGCGAVTVVVDRIGDDVVWRDLGWQNDYEPNVDFESFAGVGPFRFDRSQYEAVLSPLLQRAEAAADPSPPWAPAQRRWFRISLVRRGWWPSRRRG
jgi:hypothetical protein